MTILAAIGWTAFLALAVVYHFDDKRARDLTTKLRIAEQRADWARRQAMADHPAGRVVRGPWGGAS